MTARRFFLAMLLVWALVIAFIAFALPAEGATKDPERCRVRGYIYNVDGTPRGRFRVYVLRARRDCRPVRFRPIALTTDRKGRFEFEFERNTEILVRARGVYGLHRGKWFTVPDKGSEKFEQLQPAPRCR